LADRLLKREDKTDNPGFDRVPDTGANVDADAARVVVAGEHNAGVQIASSRCMLAPTARQ